jgi:glycosyltransferase involved in cell wall biosynthesis
MLNARGEVLVFSDADLSTPIEEAHKLFGAIEAGADVVIGSRWLQPETQTHRQSPLRQFYGRIFNLALRVLLALNFKDTQCGFKAFTRGAAQAIFPLQKIERWGFDPELLYLARRAGLTVKEVPVAWAHAEGTRLNPLRDGIRMFGEVLKIRWYALTGKYSETSSLSQNTRAGWDSHALLKHQRHFFRAVFTEPIELNVADGLSRSFIDAQGTAAVKSNFSFPAKKFSQMEIAEAHSAFGVGALGNHNASLQEILNLILLFSHKMQVFSLRIYVNS